MPLPDACGAIDSDRRFCSSLKDKGLAFFGGDIPASGCYLKEKRL